MMYLFLILPRLNDILESSLINLMCLAVKSRSPKDECESSRKGRSNESPAASLDFDPSYLLFA